MPVRGPGEARAKSMPVRGPGEARERPRRGPDQVQARERPRRGLDQAQERPVRGLGQGLSCQTPFGPYHTAGQFFTL